MSRVSIGRRLDRLFEHYRPGDSLEGRVARLSDADQERYGAFRTTNDRILNAAGPDAFERWLSGEIVLDELPPHIVDQLMPECVGVRRAMVAGNLYDAWNLMVHPDRA